MAKHLVSFDTAKELKRKGYIDFDCPDIYDENSGKLYQNYSEFSDEYIPVQNRLIAPKLSDVVEWLLDEYNISVFSIPYHRWADPNNHTYQYTVANLVYDYNNPDPNKRDSYSMSFEDSRFTYYDVLEEGIKCALKVYITDVFTEKR